jgi:alkanesulfonate monooxygenase SsuD/methylene tetrahydromethanopterin reductase-like flavin-dependent oxidoreductase (luciferase family)
MDLGLFLEFPLRPGLGEAGAFAESMELVRAAEELGLDSIWVAEIHFSPERSVLSAPLILASAIAGATKRLRIGTAVEVLPLGNPIRLAEEVATLDHVCRGRFEFGVGRSGVPRGYIGYNIPYSESRPRFFEALDVIQRAWTQESFSYQGQFYCYQNVCLVPKPYQKPHPPIRLAANSANTFPAAGKRRLHIFIGLRGVPTMMKERVQSYKASWKESGHPGEPDVSLRVPVYVAKSAAKARSDPEQSAMNFYQRLAPSLGEPLPGLSEEENRERAVRAQRLKGITYDEVLKTDTAFGTPEAVTDRLLELKESFGLSGIIAEPNFGGLLPPEQVTSSVRLFAEKVAPKLR